LATYPSRRFVQAGGLTVVHEGLLEYELVDITDGQAHELALTLLRATGMLSRVEMTYRPMPAGPPDRLEGPQMAGNVEARYAISVDPDIDPFAMVDDVFLPLMPVTSNGGGHRSAPGSALVVTGAEVSAVRRSGDELEVRVFNPTGQTAEVAINGQGRRVDLRGVRVGPFGGSLSLTPWTIETVVVNVTDG
jgi:alpha-mannosidase